MIEDDMDYEWNRLEKIREIRTKVLRLFESSLKQITFDDIILEEQIPDIGYVSHLATTMRRAVCLTHVPHHSS